MFVCVSELILFLRSCLFREASPAAGLLSATAAESSAGKEVMTGSGPREETSNKKKTETTDRKHETRVKI